MPSRIIYHNRLVDAAKARMSVVSPVALYGLLATALLAWLWTAQGFVAGIPLDAFTFLAFGAAASRVEAP